MDPYFESPSLWPTFHERFVDTIRHLLLPSVRDRYEARIEHRCYATRPEDMADGSTTDRREPFVEIRDATGDRLVTLIDVVSPINKTTPTGRSNYLATRQSVKSVGASTVEIDLVLQGEPTLGYSRDGLPQWDYAVTVERFTQPERFEIYTAMIEKRLPRFRVPLATSDRDAVLDLNAVFGRCYDHGEFSDQIDYRKDPELGSDEAIRARIRQFLATRKIHGRGPGGAPSYNDVARLAHQLWQAEGCPDGRDQQHWYRALAMLRDQSAAPRP
jgi:hypothetical protein